WRMEISWDCLSRLSFFIASSFVPTRHELRRGEPVNTDRSLTCRIGGSALTIRGDLLVITGNARKVTKKLIRRLHRFRNRATKRHKRRESILSNHAGTFVLFSNQAEILLCFLWLCICGLTSV